MPEKNPTVVPDDQPPKPPAKRRRRKKARPGEVRLRGTEVLHDPDEPTDWLPLMELVGVGLTQDFMDMGRQRLEDGTILHVYKHRDTRSSVHLTSDGRAFRYDWDGTADDPGPHDYVEITRSRLLTGVFLRYRELYGYDEARHEPLLRRACDAAHLGHKLHVDPRYPKAYEKAQRLWREVEKLADSITEDERAQGWRTLAAKDDPFDEDDF